MRCTTSPAPDVVSIEQMDAMTRNAREFGVRLYPVGAAEQGIVHVISPQLGLTLPGMTIDGSPTVETMTLPGDVNAFYQELSGRRSWFYLALHYHAWVLLRLKEWPLAFVSPLKLFRLRDRQPLCAWPEEGVCPRFGVRCLPIS